jgi:hypothetical protein
MDLLSNPTLVDVLRTVRVELRWPTFALSQPTWNDFVIAAVFLALPQVPLTLGNAVIAMNGENNRLFPQGTHVDGSHEFTERGRRAHVPRRRRHGRSRALVILYAPAMPSQSVGGSFQARNSMRTPSPTLEAPAHRAC